MIPQDKTNPLLTSGSHISIWTDTNPQQTLHPLTEDLETDVVIIGGGIAGISIAYELTRQGKSVVLVEDGLLGSGETGRTTAHLTTSLENEYQEYEKVNGEKQAALLAESHTAAIDYIEKNVHEHTIDCDFQRVDGYLFRHPSDAEDVLEKEFEAASRAGLNVSLMEHTPGMTVQEKCLCFFNQAQFHPLKYINALAELIKQNGGKIFTGTHAKEIDSTGITTEEHFTVKASHVVVATNAPVNNRFAMSFKQHAYRSYVIGALIPKNTLDSALWWDTGDYDRDKDEPPYHYVRLQPYNDEYNLLICGGEDHPTGDPGRPEPAISEEERYVLLEAWARHHFPIGDVIYRWSGQVMNALDGIAFIGKNPLDKDNVYIVTGDSGDGMTNASIAAMLIPDLINGKENRWEHLYRPNRFAWKETALFLKHNIQNVLASLKNSSDEDVNLYSVAEGEGKIVDIEGEKCGVYRDENGLISVVSARCTHLGCTVAWNGDEKTWDCPCHGSRFSTDGKVLHGPANTDLSSHKENS